MGGVKLACFGVGEAGAVCMFFMHFFRASGFVSGVVRVVFAFGYLLGCSVSVVCRVYYRQACESEVVHGTVLARRAMA